MAVLELQAAKDYLRIEHDGDDLVVSALIASALAAVQGWLGRPIELSERTFEVDTCAPFAASRYATKIFLPAYPVGDLTAVTDCEGTDLDLAALRLDARGGVISRVDKVAFVNPPYTVVAEVGLQALEEYETAVLPAIRQAVLDVVADLYQRRNPAASMEREGGGVGVQYSDQVRGVGADNRREDLITPRTAALLAPWRLLGIPG